MRIAKGLPLPRPCGYHGYSQSSAMFDFSKIFPASDKNAALNADVIKQAQGVDGKNRAVSRVFANLAETKHGLKIPLKIVDFDKYSRDYITGAMHPFKGAFALKKGEFYRGAFAAIREAMGLEAVTGPSWAPVITPEKVIAAAKKAEAKAAVKLKNAQAGKPVVSPMQSIIAALNALSPEQLGAVMQACEVQLEALGFEAVLTTHEDALM